MLWLLLTLPLYVAIDGAAQGKTTLLNRLYVPPTAQPAVNLALHTLQPLLYLVLVLVLSVSLASWYVPAIALLVRVALFDVALNLVKGDRAFAVGTSAGADKLINRIGERLHLAPATVSATMKLVAAVGAVGICLLLL